MSTMNHMPPMVNPDYWTYDTGKDVFLCDPFSGEPVCGRDLMQRPDRPPVAFANHPELGAGYAIVRGRNKAYEYEGGEPMAAGVLLTDPTRAEGLGTLHDFRTNMSLFDCVAYVTKRSVQIELATEQEEPVRRATATGDAYTSDPYMDKLLGVASELGKPICSLDPSLDPFGRLEEDTGRSLREVENVVRAEAVMQDPADSDVQLTAYDMVHANTYQWHAIGKLGLSLAALMDEYGRYPDRLLLVVPAEHGDITRKARVSGIPSVTEIFACDGLDENVDNHAYPNVMGNGKILGEALGR